MIQSYADCENEVHVDVYDMVFYMITGVMIVYRYEHGANQCGASQVSYLVLRMPTTR